MSDTVALRHPETGAEFDAHPDSVAGWEARGWEQVTDAVEEVPAELEKEPEDG